MRPLKVLIIGGMLLQPLCPNLGATGSGDVTVRLNGGGINNFVIPCLANRVEITIRNDAPLSGLVLAFEFSSLCSFQFLSPIGNRPDSRPYLQEHGDAIGRFDLGGLQVITSNLPNQLVIAGAASGPAGRLPAHSVSTLCYSMTFALTTPCPDVIGGFCVSPITTLPPGDSWTFDDGVPYDPTYAGQPVSTATPICFDILTLPCGFVDFASVPPSTVITSHCSPYRFDIDADEGSGMPPFHYECAPGSINGSTGEFTFMPPNDTLPSLIIVWVFDQSCALGCAGFTVYANNSVPLLSFCPTTPGKVASSSTYSYDFAATDLDTCDEISYAVSVSGSPPVGPYNLSPTGVFNFTPDPADDGITYRFDLTATDNHLATGLCQFSVKVTEPLTGDCDGNEVVDISDAVYLITYIFSGGLPPNPVLVGDVNCDSVTDISDVVYLIAYIFQGGPVPC